MLLLRGEFVITLTDHIIIVSCMFVVGGVHDIVLGKVSDTIFVVFCI